MFSPLVTAIPRFLIMAGYVWWHYWALILPAVASSFFTFFMRQFFEAQPSEIYAGRIDGAGEWSLFWNSDTLSLWATLTIMATECLERWIRPVMFTRSEAMKTLHCIHIHFLTPLLVKRLLQRWLRCRRIRRVLKMISSRIWDNATTITHNDCGPNANDDHESVYNHQKRFTAAMLQLQVAAPTIDSQKVHSLP